MKTILVVANQTIGSQKLIDAIQARASEGDVRVYLVVPRTRPRHGGVIYDESVRQAAEVRVELARQVMARLGIDVEGEVGDEDPYTATMDAVGHVKPDEILVSTLPATASGWLRRDLIERIQQSTGLPVDHVVTDLESEGLPFAVTLVVANQTVGAQKLLDRLKRKADESPHIFIVVVPVAGKDGNAIASARQHLDEALKTFRDAGLVVAGMVGDPDPYDATMNALQSFRVSDVIVSTFEAQKSGWLREDLIERLRDATGKPIEHVTAAEAASAAS
jgi:hypothetical protein